MSRLRHNEFLAAAIDLHSLCGIKGTTKAGQIRPNGDLLDLLNLRTAPDG